MRIFTFLSVLPLMLLSACSPVGGGSGFGSRLVPAACIAEAAPWILGEATQRAAKFEGRVATAPVLRAVTYNLHSGLGPELAFFQSRAQVERHLTGIGDTIASSPGPVDVVALNEVDFSARRSGGFDQAMYLAKHLERRTGQHYQVIYGETWRRRILGLKCASVTPSWYATRC